MTTRLLDERLAEGAKKACVKRALIACTPVQRKGLQSKCWQINEWLQLAIIEMRCVGLATLDEILAAFPNELKGVYRSNLDRWLKPIVKAYQAELNRADLGDEVTLDVAVHSGDLVAQMSVAWGSAMLMLTKYLRGVDWNDLSGPNKYTLLRFLELANDAAKTQAQVKQAEASTQRTLLKIKAILSSADGKPKADQKAALAEAFARIDDVLGLGKDAA